MTATGVVAAWLFTIISLPSLLAVLPFRVKARAAKSTTWQERFGAWIIRKRRPILVVISLCTVALAVSIPRIELNDNFVEYFSESMPYRVDSDFASEHLTGASAIQLSIKSGESGVDPQEAVRRAFNDVAAPLVTTTVVLVAVFGLLSTSTYLVNSHLGLLTSLTIVFALVTDLLLLPSLLLVWKGGGSQKTEQMDTSDPLRSTI
jgi:predicted RND superfamily exporter protein